MYIGDLSNLTGASPKAIRLYEELGLLTGVQRKGSYRVYSDKNIHQVRLIRQAQTLGFKLSELNSASFLHEGKLNWDDVETQLNRKQLAIHEEINRLTKMLQGLTEISEEIRRCRFESSSKTIDSCKQSHT